MNTIVQCNMGILDILNYDSDELMNHKSCVWIHPVNSYYSDFQMRQIVQGIKSHETSQLHIRVITFCFKGYGVSYAMVSPVTEKF